MPNPIFDCHLCNTKKTTYEILAEADEPRIEDRKDEHNYVEFRYLHQVCRCNSCFAFFYQKIQTPKIIHFTERSGFGPLPRQVPIKEDPQANKAIFVYPLPDAVLITHIDKYIQQYYKEAVDCLTIGAHDAASVMFRKCAYRVCNVESIPTNEGENKLSGKERIKRLGLPKVINDVLCNAKNLGDDAGHIDQNPYSAHLLNELKDALKIVFRLLYEDKEILKAFNQKYSQEKQEKNKQ